MIEPLQPTFILYFLVLPMVIGSGIDIRTKNRVAFGAACGVILYVFMGLWTYFGPSSSLGALEAMIILVVFGLSVLTIGLLYEYKRPISSIQRHATAFLAVSLSGLPLYMVKAIIDGQFGIGYPASLLPLFQFMLALVGLVFIANIFESRMYEKNEGSLLKPDHREEDLLYKKFEDIDETHFKERPLYSRGHGGPSTSPEIGYMGSKYDSHEILQDEDKPYPR
jgi:hypothetical protein